MNCQEFENSFEVLARGALSDAGARAEALAHEKACAACAARLADERALTGGLRALASGMKDAQTPARVEDALLAAFRARAAASASVEPSKTREGVNVVPFAPRAEAGRAEAGRVEAERVETPNTEPRRWSWAKTAAVASLAAAASLALFVLVQTRAGLNKQSVSGGVASQGKPSKMIEPPPPVGSGTQPAPAATTSRAAATSNDAASLNDGGGASQFDEGRALRAPSAAPRVRAVNASYNGGARGVRQGGVRAGEAAAQEVATEFIPLMQGAEYASAEESHLVRVELPRAALASFGLPL
ncbi:MAG TPA: hypothetical protein VNZ44_14510, partial [Pyrinomonadaceae bacterium]|nr:hypothetical protein [Pyrinomonadaceae bacterium]